MCIIKYPVLPGELIKILREYINTKLDENNKGKDNRDVS